MRIRVLGYGGGIGGGLQTTCFLIDQDILIDTGTGLSLLPVEEMAAIRHVFLTHSHLDHVAGLPFLLDYLYPGSGRPVTVYGRRETIDALRAHLFNWSLWPDFSVLPCEERPMMAFQAVGIGETVTLGRRAVELAEVNHAVPACGYRVEADGTALAISGDTTTNDSFWSALNRHHSLDLLFVETTFTDEEVEFAQLARHYCPSLLAADLRKLAHRPRVFLSHAKPGSEDKIVGQCRAHISDRELNRLYGGEVFDL